MPNQACGILSPWLRKQRINAVLPYLKGKILDYGCGTGTLAGLCQRDLYMGIDIDEESLRTARLQHPGFRFEDRIPGNEEFDTAIILAVIEHMYNPKTFLAEIKCAIKSEGLIISTTPQPAYKQLFWVGSRLRIFSAEAEAEHKVLINYRHMKDLASACGLSILCYRHFLFGANQLFILKKNNSA